MPRSQTVADVLPLRLMIMPHVIANIYHVVAGVIAKWQITAGWVMVLWLMLLPQG